ncbi:MAG: hypothetical protein HY848_11950 [Betaproteobacteria bacterium]|nr:hypothetical protein [Betaproteobacteria bacterium]
MKKLFLIALTLAIALSAIPLMNSWSLAQDRNATQGPMLAALSTSGKACEQGGVKGSTGSSPLACRSSGYITNNTFMAAVTCGSNQWCCKHEDFSKGTCARCCSK